MAGARPGAMIAIVAVTATAVAVAATDLPEATTPHHVADTAVDMGGVAGTATTLQDTTTEDHHLTVVGDMAEILTVVDIPSHVAGVATGVEVTVAAAVAVAVADTVAAAVAGTHIRGTATPTATIGPTGTHTGAHLLMTVMHPAAVVGVGVEVATVTGHPAATRPGDRDLQPDCCHPIRTAQPCRAAAMQIALQVDSAQHSDGGIMQFISARTRSAR